MTNSSTRHQTDAVGESAGPEFKGYTLQQMRARKAVNRVKIDLQKQKLINTMRRDAPDPTRPALATTIENGFRYARIALYSYKIARRAMNLFQSFRRARQS